MEERLCATYPKASKGGEVTQVVIAGCVIVFPIIALRLYARIKHSKGPWADDYATVVGAVRFAHCLFRILGN